jgi:hypothetical protein
MEKFHNGDIVCLNFDPTHNFLIEKCRPDEKGKVEVCYFNPSKGEIEHIKIEEKHLLLVDPLAK